MLKIKKVCFKKFRWSWTEVWRWSSLQSSTIDKKDKNAIFDEEIAALIGFSAGVSVQVPLGTSGKSFGIDYGYRATETFDGTHTIGARFNL